MRHIFRCPGGGIASQGHNMADTGGPIAPRNLIHLLPRRTNTRQMRGRGQAGFSDQARHRGMGAFLRGATRPISDRDESRTQWLQPPNAGPKLFFQLVCLGRKEFKGKKRCRQSRRGGRRTETRTGQPASQGARGEFVHDKSRHGEAFAFPQRRPHCPSRHSWQERGPWGKRFLLTSFSR